MVRMMRARNLLIVGLILTVVILGMQPLTT